jgi:hypothetical protein
LVGIKFSEYTGYLQRLIKADTDINSFAEAVVYLFGDDTDPRNKAAVELAEGGNQEATREGRGKCRASSKKSINGSSVSI